MKNKKIVTLFATLGLITCLYTKTNAVMFYDTMGTRYEGAVERLGELGIVNGVSPRTFDANKTVTRAEFAKLVVESIWSKDDIETLALENIEYNFKDVSKDAWYYKYVLVATNSGFINGYEDNTFRPNDEVTYEQAAKIFTKILGHTYLIETDPRGWSAEYMDKLYELNLDEGTTYFDKKDSATRGNVAIMLWNAFTENVWDKIYLNDSTGFTFVNSGKTLFSKRIKGHKYIENKQITGFADYNNELYVQIGNGLYRYYDQNTVATFSMLGGKADALLKYIRYPEDEYCYEVIGLSTDIGSTLYSGRLTELKNEGFDAPDDKYQVGTKDEYRFYIKDENDEEQDRIVSLGTGTRRFYVEEIKIDKKDSKTIEEDEEYKKQILSRKHEDYLYISKKEVATRTVKINDSYIIEDGAVLFKDNKWVKWNTVKEGDVITEIVKDKYYMLSTDTVDVSVVDYSKEGNVVTFKTSKGEYIAYSNTEWLGYFDDNAKELSRVKTKELENLKGKKAKLLLDFAGKVARIELLEGSEDTDLLEMNVGFFVGDYYIYKNEKEVCMLRMESNRTSKKYETTLSAVNADTGDIVQMIFDEKDDKKVRSVKVLNTTTEINENLKFEKESYNALTKKVKNKYLADNALICLVKYHYDFGKYDRVDSFDVNNLTLNEFEHLKSDKHEFFTIVDDDDLIRAILIKDFSEQEEIYYGKVEKIYTDRKDDKLKVKIDVIGNSDMEFLPSGLLKCEEGDLISFRLIGENSFEVCEKFSTDVLGYHKDIIVKKVSVTKEVDAINGTVNLKEGIILSQRKEHNMNDYTIILLRVDKDKEGNWVIDKATEHTLDDLRLLANDRIAINEIEDTIIVYRGYKE